MNLRILLLIAIVFVSFDSIESWKSRVSKPSRPSSTSRRPSSNTGGVRKPSNTFGGSASHTFLQNEGGGRPRPSNTGNSHGNSATRPFSPIPSPTHHSNNYGKPSNNYGNSPTRPFSPVPAPRPTPRPTFTSPSRHHTSSNHSSSIHKPFSPVPTPRPNPSVITQPGFGRPVTTRPVMGSRNYTRQPAFNPHFGNNTPLPPNRGHTATGGGFNSSRQPAYNPHFTTNTLPPHQSIPHRTNVPLNNAVPPGGASAPPYPPVGGHTPPRPGFNVPHGSSSVPYVPVPPANHAPLPPYGHAPVHPSYAQPSYHPPGGVPYPQQAPVYHPQLSSPMGIYGQPIGGHSYGQSPGHTVVVVPGQSGYSGPSTGQIFKEAIIHAGVNAAVWKLTNPSSYRDSYGHNTYVPPSQNSNPAVPSTQIITNNYYNGQPGSPATPGSPSETSVGSVAPSGYPAGNIPSSGYPAGSIPSSGYPSTPSGQPSAYPSGVPTNYPNGIPSGVIPPNDSVGGGQNPPPTGTDPNNRNPGTSVVAPGGSRQTTSKPQPTEDPNQIVYSISEKLLAMDENNAMKYIKINMQSQSVLNYSDPTAITDAASEPLLTVDPEAYSLPTIGAMHDLYNASLGPEPMSTEERRKKENLIIDLIMQTNVMTAAMNFLAENNYISKEYFDHKDTLKRIWFTTYDGTSSGFKRVFEGEAIAGAGFIGIQDWIAFDVREKAKQADYLGFVKRTDLGSSATLLKMNFKIDQVLKPETTIFIGTSPELEMALYTICHYLRPNDYCPVSLGGVKFSLYTHLFRYLGKDVIDLALPVI